MASTRALSMFVDVEAFVDGNRVGGHGTFMRIVDEATTCKELLEQFFQRNALLHANIAWSLDAYIQQRAQPDETSDNN